jgi:hypothetical protein
LTPFTQSSKFTSSLLISLNPALRNAGYPAILECTHT